MHCLSLRESLNPRDNNCVKQVNGQIMLNEKEINLCGELERKNRLHQESHARSCQEIEELKRRCYKEENEVTQQKLNGSSMQHCRESRTVTLFRDRVRNYKKNWTSSKTRRNFMIL